MKEFQNIASDFDKSIYYNERRRYQYFGYKTDAELYGGFAKISQVDYVENTLILFDRNQTDKVTYYLRLIDSTFDLHRHTAYDIVDSELLGYYGNSRTGRYLSTGFLAIQLSIEMSYLRTTVTDSIKWPTFAIGQVPIKYAKLNPQTVPIFAFLSLCTIVFMSITMVLLQIVEEKQDGIKEMIESVTECSYLNHCSLYIIGLLVNLFIMTVLMVQAFGIYDMFGCAQIIYPIVLVVLFIICTLSFTFFVSIFFDTISYAASVGALFYMLPYVLLDIDEDISYWFGFLSPLLLYDEGMVIFINFTKYRQCFAGVDIFHDEHPAVNHSIFKIYILLLVMSIVYMLLYYYFSNVLPGRLGVPKPYNFIFSVSSFLF